jgi:hypothetical protein
MKDGAVIDHGGRPPADLDEDGDAVPAASLN